MKIVIFETDAPLPIARAKHGSYGDMFKAMLQRAPSFATAGPVEYVHIHIHADSPDGGVHDLPPLRDVDAILITGSRSNAYDTHIPWINQLADYIKDALAEESKTRVVGICFGHQIIGRALGLQVGPNPAGWELSLTEMALTSEGEPHFITATQDNAKLALMQFHHDIVFPPLPANVSVLAKTDACAVQGMHRPRKLWSVQGHPEFDIDIEYELLEYAAGTGMDRKIIDAAIAKLENQETRVERDRAAAADAMAAFLLE
ncbi:similar to Saccharomyces cerevisiae YLR126C Putative glutamine amidotransferase [Geotrichum candidum]|uniref:Similar to Saccharomyces cerevisiae YLR126C Putative glutamine amidotransferase n=1 Tax=Geotrichum candidum TaxID=1173061 RepID=A0A0J9XHE0_GEOCN|nr:similar to Saccharomyces cerevisiae YLR126C Putative glutamine amidotransferase [Geotrichum candidum]